MVEPGFQFRRGNIGSKINPKNINLTLIKVKKIYINVIIGQNVYNVKYNVFFIPKLIYCYKYRNIPRKSYIISFP